MARAKSHSVRLSADDRELLTRVVRTGASSARQVRRSQVLLELDENHAEALGVPDSSQLGVAGAAGAARVHAERDGDVLATVTRKKRLTPPVPVPVAGEVEARLMAMACSAPPPGSTRWSLRRLERHVVLTEELPDLDHSTIGRALSKRRFVLT